MFSASLPGLRARSKDFARLLILGFIAAFVAVGINLLPTQYAAAAPAEPQDYAVTSNHATGTFMKQQFKTANNDFNPGTSSFTVEAWIQPNSSCASENCTYISKELAYVFAINSGTYMYKLGNGSAWYPDWTDTGVRANFDQWQHVAWVRNGQNIWLLINGHTVWSSSTGVGLANMNITTTNAFTVGGRTVSTTESFNGLIDEIRFYKSQRTDVQIRDEKDRTLTAAELADSALTGYWDFNDATADGQRIRTVQNLAANATSEGQLYSLHYGVFFYRAVNTVSTANGNTVITFKRSFIHQSGGWRVPQGVSRVNALVVGGGGAGNSRHGGGGGAGGYMYRADLPVFSGSEQAIVVGGGGIPPRSATYGQNWNGTESKFGANSVPGGGGGAWTGTTSGASSGGGTGSAAPVAVTSYSATGYVAGNVGGTGSNGSVEANWAGGAGGAGASASPTGTISVASTGGQGGAGIRNYITGTGQCYAAGGGGGVSSTSSKEGMGGKCASVANGADLIVGGAGSKGAVTATSGRVNTGSGGGGSGFVGGSNGWAGSGGTGVVIVSYSPAGVPLATDGKCDTYKYNRTIGGTNYTFQEIQNQTAPAPGFRRQTSATSVVWF